MYLPSCGFGIFYAWSVWQNVGMGPNFFNPPESVCMFMFVYVCVRACVCMQACMCGSSIDS